MNDHLTDIAAAGYVVAEWDRWQQGNCGGYAAALIHTYPHLRLGGIDFWTDPEPDGSYEFDNPAHYVAHDDDYAYDSAGRHPLPYTGVCGTGRWLPDMGSLAEFGLTDEYGECGDYTDSERTDALIHATVHDILPLDTVPPPVVWYA